MGDSGDCEVAGRNALIRGRGIVLGTHRFAVLLTPGPVPCPAQGDTSAAEVADTIVCVGLQKAG